MFACDGVYVCTAECDDGFFGSGCVMNCQCDMNDLCAKDTGACPGLCAAGFNGTNCQTGYEYSYHLYLLTAS